MCTDNNSESSASSLPLFAMSGDGQTDVIIPMVFLFGAEARQLMDALSVHTNLVVYVGETAKQSSTSIFSVRLALLYRLRTHFVSYIRPRFR